MKWIVSTLVLLTAIAVVADRNPMVPSSTLPKPEVLYRHPYGGYQSAEECLAAKWEGLWSILGDEVRQRPGPRQR
jgi:hypothetical protein